MKLADYIKLSATSAPALARALGVTHKAVYQWLHGDSVPRPEHMALIVRLTDGAVLPGDFYDLSVAQKPVRRKRGAAAA